MQELKPNPKLLETCEEINHQVSTSWQALNKGGIKLDHNDVHSSVQTAMLLGVLREIRDELRFSNHKERMSALPNSMFSTGPVAPKQGE